MFDSVKFKANKPILRHNPVSHGGLFSVKDHDPEIIDFSSNINPLGPPPKIKKYLGKQDNLISAYPDPDSTKLRKDLSWYTGVDADKIVVGNGATEIIYNFCHAFLNKKTPVLIPIPTFGEYEAAAKLSGCKVTFFKTMNLGNNLAPFITKIPKNGCIFLCNPNNPTGKILSRIQLLKIINAAKKKSTLVFVDECFIELSDYKQTIIHDLKKFENLFVLRSLTKSFGLAGLRVGYGIGNKQIISILNKIKIPWNISGIAQKAASAALCYKNYLEKTNKVISKEIKYLRNSISKIDKYSCSETSTNFILIKSKPNSKTLQKKLLRKKILIRDCSTFLGLNGNYIRIAVKTHKENMKLVKALEEI
jgi:threonine-phosphate decarboxylase